MKKNGPPQDSPLGQATRIVLLYALIAAAWILLSDRLISLLFTDSGTVTLLQTLKGWGFVVVTATLLFVALLRQLRRASGQKGKLHSLSQFQESVIDQALIWINVLDTEGRVSIWNRAAEKISGYSRGEVLGRSDIWEWLYPAPDYRAVVAAKLIGALDQGVEVEGFESSIRTKNGEKKNLSWSSRRLFDDHGRVVGSIVIGRDITAAKAAEQALRESERQLTILLANLPGMAYRCLNDEERTMQYVSDGSRQLTGYAPEALTGDRELSFSRLIHPDERERVGESIQKAIAMERPFAVEYRIRRRDGCEVWIWEQGRSVQIDGETYLEGIMVDINDRKRMEQKLAHLATRDSLTGLYNRRELERQLGEELRRSQRYARPLSLLWIDVDHFKNVNDRFGHHTGDVTLQQLSRLLRESIRKVDYAARYGGEELVIVLPEMHRYEALEMAERLRSLVETRTLSMANGEMVAITISIGVASYPEDATTVKQLLEVADRAMYHAKERGRNQVCCVGN